MIYVFSVAEQESFDAMPRWGKEATDNIEGDFIPLIVGNKADLLHEQRRVSDADAYDFAERAEIPYRLVSAKSGEGVDEVF